MLALYLAQRDGFKVDLFEALEESRISGPTERSWNVVISPRGSRALKAGGADLHEEVRGLTGQFTLDAHTYVIACGRFRRREESLLNKDRNRTNLTFSRKMKHFKRAQERAGT